MRNRREGLYTVKHHLCSWRTVVLGRGAGIGVRLGGNILNSLSVSKSVIF